MGQSLSRIYIHLIFHITTSSPVIRDADLERVHSYMGQLVNLTGCDVVRVGGVGNHVHVLFLLSTTESLSHVVEEIKRNMGHRTKRICSVVLWNRLNALVLRELD